MEYISAKEFRKQPTKVQNFLIDWWKPSKGDLLYPDYDEKGTNFINMVVDYDNELIKIRNGSNVWYEKDRALPLFTEGQLRKFIEETTGGVIKIIQWNLEDTDLSKKGYSIDILNKCKYQVISHYQDLGEDLIKAYWKVVCDVAIRKSAFKDDIRNHICTGEPPF